MDGHSKRTFLRLLGGAAGAQLLDFGGFVPAHAASAGDSGLWSVDAAGLTVSQGMWASRELPSGVHFESVFVRQPDGVRLHLLLFLPASAKAGTRVGTALDADPYRREPSSGGARNQEYFAARGIAGAYLAVRGSGTSEGIPSDEYAADEIEDTGRIVDWISKQPWSNGNVGMHGISYSAFNSVWVAAALKPPALKAIFVRAGTHNRYTDDIHYPGGTMVMVNNAWALGMLTSNATPGAPDYAIDSKASLDRWNTPPWLQVFLRHQTDGPHWQRGSLWPDYGRLTTPTFLAGGYLDKYQNFVPLIMRHAPAVTMGILGPWHHSMTWPGPAVNWNALMTRWFDHWLNGRDTGMLREPRVTFYMPGWQRQSFRSRDDVPGEWRTMADWPAATFAPAERLYLRPSPEVPVAQALRAPIPPGRGGGLSGLAGRASALRLDYRPGRGGTDQSFGPTSSNGYYGIDHRDEDAYGLCFDTEPLREPVEILGFVRANLFVSATAPIANWIVRLHDLAPDGTSYLITRGFLNGTHRASHEKPEPLVPDQVYEIGLELMCTGYRFAPGHRIRVVVANADFPVIWPSPYPMTTTLYTGGDRPSHVALPVLPPGRSKPVAAPLAGGGPAEPLADRRSADSVRRYLMTRDYSNGDVRAEFQLGSQTIVCRVNENDPAAASLDVTANVRNQAADGRVIETRATGSLSSTAERFTLDMQATLLANGREIRSKTWHDATPRQLL